MYFPQRQDALALDWAAAESAHCIARGRASLFTPGELSITQSLLHSLLSQHQPQVVACWDEQLLSRGTWTAPAHRPLPFSPATGRTPTAFPRAGMHVLSQKEEARLGADWLIVLAEPGNRHWRALLVQAKIMKATTRKLAPEYEALDHEQTAALVAAEVHARSVAGWPLYSMYAFYNYMPWSCPRHDSPQTYGRKTACVASRAAASFGVTLVAARTLDRLPRTATGEYTATAKRAAADDARPFSCVLECTCLGKAGLPALDDLVRVGTEVPLPELSPNDLVLPFQLAAVLNGEGDSVALNGILRDALGPTAGTEPQAPPVAGVLVAELAADLAAVAEAD